MADEVLAHKIYFPFFLRIMFCAFGLLLLVVVPYELWRGVWPLSFVTPFFGMLMIAGLGGAGSLLSLGLFTPERTLNFRRNELSVTDQWPLRSRTEVIEGEAISEIVVRAYVNSEGPDTWKVEINLHSGRKFDSRPFESKQAAEKQAADFRLALGWK